MLLVQVFDQDNAVIAVDLADKLESAIASELILPEKHRLHPSPGSLLTAEIE